MDTFPSGIDRYAFLDEVRRLERTSRFSEVRRNFFDEGPHLVSSAELPWGDEVRHLAVDAYQRFLHGETWMTGGGAREMEADIVRWMGSILGSEAATGFVTSGGSESNMCAILTAKQRAARALKGGSVVFPAFAHYSLHKLCAMFGLDAIPVEPLAGSRCQVDPAAIEAAIRPDTIALVATAGNWAFGNVDPIEEIGEIAIEKGIYFHVDGAFGGYILPFLERGGYDRTIRPWDFRVPGVCSITADLHKNGMAPPPASTLFFRNAELLEHAKLICPPNGTISGTRGAGPIAGAWSMIKLLGEPGYTAIANKSMALRDALISGIEGIAGLRVYPGSKINIALIYSEEVDLRPVVEALRAKGWMFSARATPPPVSIVVVPMPQSDGQIESLLEDFRSAMSMAVPFDGVAGAASGKPVSLYGF